MEKSRKIQLLRETDLLSFFDESTLSKLVEENHQGKLWFETEVGKGTTFHFTRPTSSEGGNVAVTLTRPPFPYKPA